MKEYTVGFMFDDAEERIVLLKKKKKKGLEFLEGLWNGVGGTIEKDELPAVCMAREFEEEAGIKTSPEDWTLFAIVAGNEYTVNFYFTHYNDLYLLKQCEEEEVAIFSVHPYPSCNMAYHSVGIVDNLKFLIPLALNCKNLSKPIWFFDEGV